MDVLRPKCIYVDGRCYRINEGDLEDNDIKQSGVEWDDYPSNYGSACTLDEPCDDNDDYEIISMGNRRYKTKFHVAKVYYPPIIGTKGQTRIRLEDETKTIIKIPRNSQDNEIMITGSTRRSVATARRRIELIMLNFRRKQPATHFLSIPMVTPEVKERFLQFKEQVIQDCQAQGVDESIFQDPNKLHLTLCTFVVIDEVDRLKAVKVLEDCQQQVINPIMEGNSITILLSGIEYMNDDPAEVDVLYAKVLADGILQRLVDEVVDYCSNAGLLDKQFESVKLHVTVMNTLFRQSKRKDVGKPNKRETFNAAPILERFKDFEFGEVTIDKIHLSVRYTTSNTDGYYKFTAELSLLI